MPTALREDLAPLSTKTSRRFHLQRTVIERLEFYRAAGQNPQLTADFTQRFADALIDAVLALGDK